AVTGTGITGSGSTAYIVSINSASKTVTLNANPAATSGSDFATAATTVTTSQTVASIATSAGTLNNIVISPNGGAGTTLSVTSGAASFGAGSSLKVNTAAGGANATGPSATVGTGLMVWALGT